MKMYKTTLFSLEIQEREIARQTTAFLFWQDGGRERRSAKLGFMHKWHASRRAALEHQHQEAIKKATRAQRMLDEATEEFRLIQIEFKHLKEEQ